MTHWLNRRPGEHTAVLDEEGDGALLLIGADRPDWIRLPPELGGAGVRVIESLRAKCPVHNHKCLTHRLANGVSVAECNNFYWYTEQTTENV